MNGESELPEGWAATTVGFFFKIVGGGTPSTKKVEYWDGTIPWITSADISGFQVIPRKNVTELGVKESATKIVPVKSIIVVTRVGLGKIALAEKPLCFSQDCHALITKDMPIDPKYALFFLSLEVERFRYENRGTTITGVTVKQLSDLPLLLPPLAEQHRIVAAVEQLLARVNASRERLDRVPGLLKAFRQAVLAAACSGRLTEGWREEHPDVEKSSQLLEQIQNQRIKEWKSIIENNARLKQKNYPHPDSHETNNLYELPPNWIWGSLDQIVKENKPILYGILKPGPDISDGIPYVRVNEMDDGKYIDTTFLRRTTSEIALKYKRSILEQEDLLISKDGTIGKVSIVPSTLTGGNINQHIVRAAIHPFLDKKYIIYSLQSQFSQQWLQDHKKGVALQGVNVEDFRRLPIPLPPLPEQEEIVRRVESLFALADRIEQRVAAGKERADQLTQAILAKAFRGELVPTEAELARSEEREYEPASVLLERIKADRAIIPAKGKRK